MYKLTFYDQRCCPICDGTVSYYVDSLEEFESHWLREPKTSIETINNYFRSKFGQVATDYRDPNDSSLNIVQEDKYSKMISENSFTYTNKVITTRNAYECESQYHFDKLKIDLRKVKYNSELLLLAKYRAEGVAKLFELSDRSDHEIGTYTALRYYGNPIAHYDNGMLNYIGQHYSNDKKIYKETSLESFAWLEIPNTNENNAISELDDEQLAYLFCDIPGEAG